MFRLLRISVALAMSAVGLIAVTAATLPAQQDLAVTKKAAEKRIKELVEQQKQLHERIFEITGRFAKSKHLKLDGAEQAALQAHRDPLYFEQSNIQQIVGIAERAAATEPAAKRATLRTWELNSLGERLAMAIPPRIRRLSLTQERGHTRLESAPSQGASKEEIDIMRREVDALDNARAAEEQVAISLAQYLLAVGAPSLQDYKEQLEAVQARARAKSAQRMSPEQAGAIVLGAWSILAFGSGPLPPDQLNAVRQSARLRCDYLGGLFMPGTGNEAGTCSR